MQQAETILRMLLTISHMAINIILVTITNKIFVLIKSCLLRNP
uniref:Uncharacterized protein n=1 Tax=Rhizophora mucronata TaxID=61149 RepID=A0A2P2PZ43_RHIMU